MPPVNRKTALCHTVAGTWVALFRGMLPLGHARTDKLTGHRRRETSVL